MADLLISTASMQRGAGISDGIRNETERTLWFLWRLFLYKANWRIRKPALCVISFSVLPFLTLAAWAEKRVWRDTYLQGIWPFCTSKKKERKSFWAQVLQSISGWVGSLHLSSSTQGSKRWCYLQRVVHSICSQVVDAYIKSGTMTLSRSLGNRGIT